MMEASNTTLLSTNFPVGIEFDTQTKAAKSIKIFILNKKEYVLVVLPIYCHIACREERTVKGEASNTTHDFFHKLVKDAYLWMTIMTE